MSYRASESPAAISAGGGVCRLTASSTIAQVRADFGRGKGQIWKPFALRRTGKVQTFEVIPVTRIRVV